MVEHHEIHHTWHHLQPVTSQKNLYNLKDTFTVTNYECVFHIAVNDEWPNLKIALLCRKEEGLATVFKKFLSENSMRIQITISLFTDCIQTDFRRKKKLRQFFVYIFFTNFDQNVNFYPKYIFLAELFFINVDPKFSFCFDNLFHTARSETFSAIDVSVEVYNEKVPIS